ncbi:PhzF family phenazine biosynthesis isomerase [Kineococcus glutinatus]|uniref:PhzF family phenazine biosynthesis isomerase n=1 Tax=Kineococcus glutinatus TaxID=1070872 RepID=A0ABP9HHS1_9ACTN
MDDLRTTADAPATTVPGPAGQDAGAGAVEVLRLSSFAAEPHGGNPAGVVLDARSLSAARMQELAAEVGYSETAFVVDPAVGGDGRRVRVRYFSPAGEVPFCGHATIATAVVLAQRRGAGAFVVDTAVGPVVIDTAVGGRGRVVASFTSVEPAVRDLDAAAAARLLELLGVGRGDLDERWPLREAFAGNWHPVLALRDQAVFDGFTFEPGAVRALMDEQGWAGTVTVVHARGADPSVPGATVVEARNLFPVGDITEDPATGAAAAALAAYLREIGAVEAPARVVVHQGRHVGRPSVLVADVPATGGVTVSGTADPLP